MSKNQHAREEIALLWTYHSYYCKSHYGLYNYVEKNMHLKTSSAQEKKGQKVVWDSEVCYFERQKFSLA